MTRTRVRVPAAPSSLSEHAGGRVQSRRSSAPSTSVRALVALEAVVAVSGLGGGIYLVMNPMTAMPLRYLDGTWFSNWRWPGVALAVFVGFCPAVVAAAALAGRRIAVAGHLCVGVGLVAWIVLEASWVVVAPVLQTLFGGIGVVITLLAVRELRRPD